MTASPSSTGRRVAIAGATGAVGQDLRRLLDRRDFPLDDLVLLASPRSAAKVIRWRDRDITVKDLSDADAFDGVDVFSRANSRAVADSKDVGINRLSRGAPPHIEHNIGRFAAHSGQ